MTIFSTMTYQACKFEYADKTISHIPCKKTALSHEYDALKMFRNLEYELQQLNTVLVTIQNNNLMNEYEGIDIEFDQWSCEANDFIARFDGGLVQPFQDNQTVVYLITAYGFDEDQDKAELKSVDASFSPRQIHFTIHLDCVMDIVSILLSHISRTSFIEIERTTLENAKYQVTKRLDLNMLHDPENVALLGHAGDYFQVYNLYNNCGTQHAHFDYKNNLTKIQAQQAIKEIKGLNWHFNPKTLVVQGCILIDKATQECEYEQALIDIDRPCDFDQGVIPNKERAKWVVESYNHSQSIRQAIGNQQHQEHI